MDSCSHFFFISVLFYFISFARTIIANNDKQEQIQYGQGDRSSSRQLLQTRTVKTYKILGNQVI